MSQMSFAAQIIAAADTLGPLCVGIDPHPGRIPDLFGGDTADGVERWSLAVLDAISGVAGVVKPQVGLYERHGAEGMAALSKVCHRARDLGLTVIADAKRGDIGSTAEGYAAAYLSDDAPFPADCVTVNPYMGLDTLEPFLKRAEATGRGVAVLARTSNPGSGDFQARDMGGEPLFLRVVDALAPAIERLMDQNAGWSSLMLVAGATGPAEAHQIRKRAPDALFLVPGYGTQGAGASDALAGFVPGLAGGLAGGVVNASRAITFPSSATEAKTLDAWSESVAEAARAAQAELKAASALV